MKKHIWIATQADAAKFVSILTKSGESNRYILETENQLYRVDAASLLGVLYFITEHKNDCYLINTTNDTFPEEINSFEMQ